jgi:hypothetical protein
MEPLAHSSLAAALDWAQWYLAPILALAVSVVYLATSPKLQSLSARLWASSAGFFIATIYCVAAAIAALRLSRVALGVPFDIAVFLGLGLIGLSFWMYRGKKVVHLLQLVNLACLAWTGFIGGMAITGRWL